MPARSLVALALAAASAARAADPEPQLAAPPELAGPVQAPLPPETLFPAPSVEVVLSLDVGADGRVERASLERGAGEPFDSAALAAAPTLTFRPARLEGGEPVPVTISFRVRFDAPPPPAPPPPRPVRLEGTLLERGTRRPLAGVAVEARAGERTLAAAATDAAGRFALEVPEASFRLVAAPPDHVRLDAPVEAVPGERREETWYLEAEPGGFVAVVRGERVQREVTRQVLPADEVAQVAGTQGDTLKAVLNMPGAARSAFGGGQLVLRGSAPGDSAVFVEGLELPLLYHFGGLRSTFAPRFLEAVEFVPGSFAPDYGRLTGGVVNVRVRDPAEDAAHGEADFNLYDAGAAAEGPLGKGWTAGAAFRRSWVDAILPAVLPSDANLSFQTAPRFWDYQAVASWRGEADKVRFLLFGSQDELVAILKRPAGDPAVSGTLQVDVHFHALLASWSRAFSPSLRQESTLALGLQGFETSVGPSLFFELDIRRVDARTTWAWQARPGVEARAGLDLQSAFYDIALDVPRPPKEGEPPTPLSTRPRVAARFSGELHGPAAFAEARLAPVESVSILPSLRLDYASGVRRWSLDPRLMVRWKLGEATALKAATGLYQQPPAPEESSSAIGAPHLLVQRSVQASAGLERAVAPGWDLDATAFHKWLDRMVVTNPAAAVDPSAPPYDNAGRGRIYGLEVLLRARLGERFFGWIAYTFQRSFRTDRPGRAERIFSIDQPHILTAVASWRASSRWTLGGRFRLVSGNPYTPISGSVYDAGLDVFVPVYGDVNAGRLGAFWSLDLRVDRTWTFDRWRFSAYLDVQNATNRENQEGWQYRFDYRERTPLTGLPVLPILGMKGEW
ncbi:MAG TPA: TonB family protein [Anaeromyxobacteraceae bacterium]|jgi:TonB family protein